jgi:hypothetical protein
VRHGLYSSGCLIISGLNRVRKYWAAVHVLAWEYTLVGCCAGPLSGLIGLVQLLLILKEQGSVTLFFCRPQLTEENGEVAAVMPRSGIGVGENDPEMVLNLF